MKRIQHILAFIPMLVFIMGSCSKVDDPINPETYGGTYTTPSGDGSSNEVKCPEGTMSYNMVASNTSYSSVISSNFYLDKYYNFHFYGEGYGIVRIGVINGLSALNINNLPTNGWSGYMSCDEGWTYILRDGDSYYGVYVYKILADGAQIWYCPFTPKMGWNQ